MKKKSVIVFVFCHQITEVVYLSEIIGKLLPALEFKFEKVSSTTFREMSVEKGIVDIISKLSPMKAIHISIGRNFIIDITQPNYETEVFATCSESLVALQSRIGNKMKSKIKECTSEEDDETNFSDDDNESFGSGTENEDLDEDNVVKECSQSIRKRKSMISPSKEGDFSPKVWSMPTNAAAVRKNIFDDSASSSFEFQTLTILKEKSNNLVTEYERKKEKQLQTNIQDIDRLIDC